MEMALRQSEAKFAGAFRASPNPIGIARLADGRFIEVNDSFLELSGYDRLEIIGHTASELQLWASPALQAEREKLDKLLLNILPRAIAEKLKQGSIAIAQQFALVSILFADIVGFTSLASRLSPIELVNLLNQVFSTFDRLADTHGLEKIKTIGDAYMVAGGLPVPREDCVVAIADMALDMQRAIVDLQTQTGESFQIRIGIHIGPVVAGTIGMKKFAYDLWGDTVNIASRMESQGLPGKIQVSAETYEQLQHQYILEKRGKIPVKGKGEMVCYWLLDRR